MKKLKILLVQYKPIYLNIKANMSKFRRMLKKYRYLKPDLVVFPEYALSGPLYSNYHLSFKKIDPIWKELSLLAKQHNVYFIPGSFIRKIDNEKYNSTCLITPQGKILGFSDKKCLWSSEKRYLSKGKAVSVFNLRGSKVVFQICTDLHSSFLSHHYKKIKPYLIINLAMWSQEDIKACNKYVPVNVELNQTEILVKARALENRCYMIFCNFGGGLNIKAKTGRTYRETSIGNSMVVNPFGEIISKATTNKEEVVFAEIDLSKCHWSKHFC